MKDVQAYKKEHRDTIISGIIGTTLLCLVPPMLVAMAAAFAELDMAILNPLNWNPAGRFISAIWVFAATPIGMGVTADMLNDLKKKYR